MQWEVTENNGGGVTLVVWKDLYGNKYVHVGYEYTPGNLLEDIKALYSEDNSDTSVWEGNFLEENEIPIEEVYDDHPTTKIIAERDEEGFSINVSLLGNAGKKCFGF